MKKKESLEMTEMSVKCFQLTLEKRTGEGVAGYLFYSGMEGVSWGQPGENTL